MSETGARLRALFETTVPPLDIAAVMSDERAIPGRRRGLLIAAATAAVVTVVTLGGWLLVERRRAEPPVITTPPVVTSTTVGTTTTVAATGLPTAGPLDALGAYEAGPVPSPATCPPGSTPDVAGDSAAPRPPASDVATGGVAFDRQSGLLVLRGETSTWLFDPCRNRWEGGTVEGPPWEPWAYTWMVYDEDSDLVVASDGTSVWTYDTEADLWSQLPVHSLPGIAGQARYHPPSGLIVVFEDEANGIDRLYAYDVDAALRRYLGYGLDLGDGQWGRGPVVYDRNRDRWYLYRIGPLDRKSTWEYLPGSGWVLVGVMTAAGNLPFGDLYNGEEIAFDEESGWITLLTMGQLAGFDPTLPAWEIFYSVSREAMPADGPTYRTGAELVYDSANGRLIMLGGWLADIGQTPASDVWAYDMATREWILLMAAQ